MNNSKTPSRDLPSILLAVLVLGLLTVGSFWVLRPFLPALIWAAMIVIASWRLMIRAQAMLKGSRALAVLVMTSALVLVLILPLTVAFSAIIGNIGIVGEQIQKLSAHGFPRPPDWLGGIPVLGPRLLIRWQQVAEADRGEVISKLAPFMGQAATWVALQLGGLGRILVHFLLTLILSAVLWAKGERAAEGVKRFARRLAKERGEEAVILAGQAIRAVANGVIVTALVQTVMAGLGFVLAGVPYAAILSSLTFLLCVIQVGAGPVLVGSIIWLFYYGGSAAAWLFLIWAVVVMATDNFVRPYLIKRGADLPLLLIFAGVIGGLIAFGIIGIFIGPVVLAVSYTLLQAWIKDGVPTTAENAVR